MDIKPELTPPVLTLLMSGHFDFNIHREFRNAMQDAISTPGITRIKVDMSGVTYLDSSALGMLLLYHEKAAEIGMDIVLVNPSEQAWKVLDIARMDQLFTILTE